ncbi:MAG: ABC transporter ATP-binding protein [Nitrospirae bacterium]|nr:ABC transporter ATP-binding protein [Nitrospirota bacterium]
MIDIRNLNMRLMSGGREVHILKDISFHVPPGQFLAVVGPSGSGKSTLLGLMAGLDIPSSGEILLNGTSIQDMEEDRLSLLRLGLIGYVFQSFQLIPTLTAFENVLVPLELSGFPDAEERAGALLAEVGIGERAHHYPAQLSGGEQQRVAIARAVANRPPILLADEPTGNLDSATGRMVVDLLVQWHKDLQNTMVLVTHDPALAFHADRMIVLKDGRIVDEKTAPFPVF